MAIDKEKLRRVEKFEELALGMRVVVSPCQWCGAWDTGVLVEYRPLVMGRFPSGAYEECPGYRMVGACDNRRSWATPTAVEQGLVYRYAEDVESGEEITVSLRARGGVLEVV